MVQTKQGSTKNPWLMYLKLCGEYYKAGHTAPPPLPMEATDTEQTPYKHRKRKFYRWRQKHKT